MYSLLVVGAFASSAFAQALTFSNTTFTAPVTVGSIWPISFSAGNNDPVAIAFGNTTYAFQIVGKSASISERIEHLLMNYRWPCRTRLIQLASRSARQRRSRHIPTRPSPRRIRPSLQPSIQPSHPARRDVFHNRRPNHRRRIPNRHSSSDANRHSHLHPTNGQHHQQLLSDIHLLRRGMRLPPDQHMRVLGHANFHFNDHRHLQRRGLWMHDHSHCSMR